MRRKPISIRSFDNPMLDATTIQDVGAFLFVAPIAGAAGLGRAVLGPRRRTLASRKPARGTEPLWLGVIGAAQLWALGVALDPTWFYVDLSLGNFPLSTLVQGLGLMLWILGAGLALCAFRTLGRFMMVSIQVSEGHRLIQEGPYAFVRHPTYTGVIIFVLGLALVFLSIPLLLAAVLVAGLARYRARIEEELLRSPEGFGAAYEAYMARTGRFLPRLRSTKGGQA